MPNGLPTWSTTDLPFLDFWRNGPLPNWYPNQGMRHCHGTWSLKLTKSLLFERCCDLFLFRKCTARNCFKVWTTTMHSALFQDLLGHNLSGQMCDISHIVATRRTKQRSWQPAAKLLVYPITIWPLLGLTDCRPNHERPVDYSFCLLQAWLRLAWIEVAARTTCFRALPLVQS